jgi:N-formylglutamate amidohydrolase
MIVRTQTAPDRPPPVEILAPARQAAAAVLASPHSGSRYPPEFVAGAQLGFPALRRSEDCYVDELFAAAPRLGLPLVRALFPRVFVDPNREPFELDPDMFQEALPGYVNTGSARVAAGFGTIARIVANGEPIYGRRLTFAEARHRVDNYYRPYHDALRQAITQTKLMFGRCLLVDCHSMPSIGGPTETDAGNSRVDIVLGDCHGTSCAPLVTDRLEEAFAAMGYRVARNSPYSGGFVTQHYGNVRAGLHAVQIEINRALYAVETTMERGPAFAAVAADMERLIGAVLAIAESIGAGDSA